MNGQQSVAIKMFTKEEEWKICGDDDERQTNAAINFKVLEYFHATLSLTTKDRSA